MSGKKLMRGALGESSTSESNYESTPRTTQNRSSRSAQQTPQQSPRKAKAKGKENSTPTSRPRTAQASNMRPPAAAGKPKPRTRKASTSSESSVYTSEATESPPTQPAARPKPTGAAKRKQKPGVAVIKEIVRMQKEVKCTIPRAPFQRLVREIMQHESHQDLRVTPLAIEALREAAEAYITIMFGDSYKITMNRKQVTLQPRDIQLLMFLRGPNS